MPRSATTEPNELTSFAENLPALRAIAFNGATAASIGRGQMRGDRFALVDLPSSSAANASLSLAEKTARWLVLREFLD